MFTLYCFGCPVDLATWVYSQEVNFCRNDPLKNIQTQNPIKVTHYTVLWDKLDFLTM